MDSTLRLFLSKLNNFSLAATLRYAIDARIILILLFASNILVILNFMALFFLD